MPGAGGPYSRRLLYTQNRENWVYHDVPKGFREVVRHVSVFGAGVAGDYVQISIAGVSVFIHMFQAGQRHAFYDVRWTAYGGERIGFYGHGAQTSGGLDGFQFRSSEAIDNADAQELGDAPLVPTAIEDLPDPVMATWRC